MKIVRQLFQILSCFPAVCERRNTSIVSDKRMEKRFLVGFSVVVVFLAAYAVALPSSLVQEIKSSEESRGNKVKRSQGVSTPEENEDVGYINKPTAIKRGANVNLKTTNMADQQSINDWMQDQSVLRNQFNMDNIQSGLYNPEIPFEDKTIADYEKGFRYGTNKDKLDEALENAVLKSELYGEPAMINQYRYYGADDKRRRRRDAKMLRLKREVELSPEEVLALLTLYENNRQQESENNYRKPWTRYGKQFDFEMDQDDLERNNEENWLDNPVYPHVGSANDINSNMFDYDVPQIYNKKSGSWGGFSDNKKKRFMVSKKRAEDPTRMLRYLKGPNENDFNTLSKLLSNQREPKLNVPVYRRFVL